MKKLNRIKKNYEFQRIITAGKYVSSRKFVVYYQPAVFDYDRVGISVGKKLGDAVKRNQIKRQVRMMVQEINNFDNGYDFIIIVRKGYLNKNYAENKNDLSSLCYSVYNKKDELKKES